MSARIQVNVGDTSVDIEVTGDEVRTLNGIVNPYASFVGAIRVAAGALGLPVADLAAMIADRPTE